MSSDSDPLQSTPDTDESTPAQADEPQGSISQLIRTALTYNTNLMLGAIVSLLVVILFVLLLHLYTRWFIIQARRRRRSSVTLPRVLGPRLNNRLTILDTPTTNPGNSQRKLGLPYSIIATLPLFVYKSPPEEDRENRLDCAICLSGFEEEEIGRKLPGCGHAFHVECIDMWLHSHSSCPICRATVQRNHCRKIEHLEIEVADPEPQSESGGGGLSDEITELRLENVIAISDEITEAHEAADAVAADDAGVGGASSSSIGESVKKFLSSSSSCSSRTGGKIHPSADVNGDASET